MAFLQKTWKDRVAEYINRRVLTKEDGTTELVSVERSEGTISQEGDAFSAANMNDLEQRIADEFSEQNKKLNKKLNNNFNEMADVVDLEKQTQPYIVQKDGLLTATLNSSTTQWGYGNVSINGIIRGQVQNISNSATAMEITFEVYKGDVLTWESGGGGSVFLGIHYRK